MDKGSSQWIWLKRNNPWKAETPSHKRAHYCPCVPCPTVPEFHPGQDSSPTQLEEKFDWLSLTCPKSWPESMHLNTPQRLQLMANWLVCSGPATREMHLFRYTNQLSSFFFDTTVVNTATANRECLMKSCKWHWQRGRGEKFRGTTLNGWHHGYYSDRLTGISLSFPSSRTVVPTWTVSQSGFSHQ